MSFATLEVWAGIGILAVAIGYEIRDVRQPGVAVPQEEASKMFPGFAVAQGTFERKGARLYRVNSDGQRIDLARWNLDTQNGEFFKHVKRPGLPDSVVRQPYKQRYGAYVGPRIGKLVKATVAVLATGAVAAIAAYVLNASQGNPIGYWAGYIFFTLGVGGAVYSAIEPMMENRARNVGPEPLDIILGGLEPQVTDDGLLETSPVAEATIFHDPNE